MVSHDREFLDTVCTDIIHLHDLKLQYYRGSFQVCDSFRCESGLNVLHHPHSKNGVRVALGTG